MEKSNDEVLQNSSPKTSQDINSATSSQESPAGISPCSTQESRQIGLFGQEVVPVPRSPSLGEKRRVLNAKAKTLFRILSEPGSLSAVNAEMNGLRMEDICGPSSFALSPSASHQSSSGNRLRVLMDSYGSQEYELRWKALDTVCSVRICALLASGRRTSGKGSGGVDGWRTISNQEPGINTERLVTKDRKPWTPGQRAYDKETGRLEQVGLTQEVQATLSGWATPRTGKTTNENWETWQKRKDRGDVETMPLTLQAQMAGWPTPDGNSKGGGEYNDSEKAIARFQNIRRHYALREAVHLAGWATLRNGGDGGTAEHCDLSGQASGLTPDQSPAKTAKPGGYLLNPKFSLWLQGFPAEWASCAPQGTRFPRKSGRSSSKR